MPTDLDKEQNDHPQTENFLFSALALEKAARSNFQNRPLVQYPEMETIDHKKKRIARACATLSGSASRCPSVLHQRQKQAPEKKNQTCAPFPERERSTAGTSPASLQLLEKAVTSSFQYSSSKSAVSSQVLLSSSIG